MISSDLLTKALVAAGIREDAIDIFDEDYELLTPGAITGELSGLLADTLFQLEIRYVESQFDCNKFAKLASTLADLSWLKTRNEEAAVAFGLFGMPGHMLNVAVHLKGDHADRSEHTTPDFPATSPASAVTAQEVTADDLRVAFYEPQPTVPEGERVFSAVPLCEITLTPEQIKGCFLCEFI